MAYKVLVSDKLSEEGLKILKENPEIELVNKPGLSKEDLLKEIKDADALIVRSGTKVTADVIEAAEKLKVIGRAGIGVDNIDLNAASRKGIIVMNTPGGNATAAAEHAIAMMAALARNIPQAHMSMKQGKWEKKKFMGVELTGKTLGVVGLGNIGRIVAERGRGLKMQVVAYDPFVSADKVKHLGVEVVPLDEVFARSDFITIHTPLTEETRYMIDKNAFAKMKDGVRIINCARGGIIKEDDLVEAIESGKVAGAALDVFENEPLPADSPLIKNDKIVLTPHLGASTVEAQVNVAVAIAKQIVDYLVNGNIVNAVNMPSVSPDLYKVLKPYINLGEKLGALATQLISAPVEAIGIEYSGKVADLNVKPITSAVLKGFLAPILEIEVNYVNAPYIARDRGIVINEITSPEKHPYESLITVQVKTEDGYHKVSGTIFGKEEPRIVNIDEFEVEAAPYGAVLLIENYDRPGVIGKLGSLLGSRGINIDQMHVGRKKGGETALSMIQLTEPVDNEIIEEIKKIDDIISIKQVKF